MGKVTRRQFLKGAVARGAAMAASITASGVLQKAYAQKAKLSILFVNHWVPGASDIHKEIINEWAKKNNVEINIDCVAQVRDIRSIASAEIKAGAGHDVMMLCTFDGASFKKELEPLNDVADYIQKKYGKFDELSTYLSYQDGTWVTIPTPINSHSYSMVSRIDLFREHAGINLLDLFPTDPTKGDRGKVDAWTYNAFLMQLKNSTMPDIHSEIPSVRSATPTAGSVRYFFPLGLLERPQQWKMLDAAQGYDMPQLKPMYAHSVWEEQGPPKGTLYNYIPRGDEQLVVGGWPAPPEIGAEIYNQYIIQTMVAKGDHRRNAS